MFFVFSNDYFSTQSPYALLSSTAAFFSPMIFETASLKHFTVPKLGFYLTC